MLGSDFDGERANAAFMANKLVKEAGLTWEQVIAGNLDGQRQQSNGQGPKDGPFKAPPTVAEKVQFIFASKMHLTAWEVQFLNDIVNYSKLSIRQEEVFDRILQKAKERWGR